jgi:transcriptional regulator with XRE-family HTH domain
MPDTITVLESRQADDLQTPPQTAQTFGARPETAETFEARDQKLGAVIRHFRTREGLSQVAVAKEMGHKTPEWLGLIEGGLRSIDLEKIPRLAGILKVDATDLAVLAMFEYYPGVSSLLFPTRGGLTPRDAAGEQVQLLPETLEHAQRFETLSVEHRQLVDGMARALMQCTRSAVRINRRKL